MSKNNPKGRLALSIGFVMDPMEKLHYKYDSSISIMMEVEARGHEIFYLEPKDLFFEKNGAFAKARHVIIKTRREGFRVLETKYADLKSFDIIFIRKDPPFNLSYLYLTQLLELVCPDVFVINSPEGIRKANEKLHILDFPEWIPPTLATNSPERIAEFQNKIKSDLILKPLHQKGGTGIRLLLKKSGQKDRILRGFTHNGARWVMAQKFIANGPKIGDKRILILNGKVLGQFKRVPKKGEFRANLSLGGDYQNTALTSREKQLARAVAPRLAQDGLYFAGIDTVDGWLTEINVTSPAGIVEINELENLHVETKVVDFLEETVLRRQI